MRADRLEALPHPGAVVAGKFEIVRALQSGGMGVVFEARHLVTGRALALKWLKTSGHATPAQLARFIREAQAAGRIQHPHVVDVYDVGEHEGGHFLVMELLRGESLAERIIRSRLSLRDAVQLMLPVMHAVAAAHRRGVTHRDLKPDNIFICHNEDGSVWGPKVLDFGISKVVDLELSPLTVTGAVFGTPHYMSPEQLRGLRETDHRTDIYSLGVILFEALTGYLPFSGDSYAAIAIEIATAKLPPLCGLRPDLPRAAQHTVEKAVHRDPAQRYQTALEFAEALVLLSPESVGRHAEVAPAVAGPFAASGEGSGVRSSPNGGDFGSLAALSVPTTVAVTPEPLRIPPTRESVVDRDVSPARAPTPTQAPPRNRFALALFALAMVGVAGLAAFLGGKAADRSGVSATTPASVPVASPPHEGAEPTDAAGAETRSALRAPLGSAAPAGSAPQAPAPFSTQRVATRDSETAPAPAGSGPADASPEGDQSRSSRAGERRRRTGSLAPSDF